MEEYNTHCSAAVNNRCIALDLIGFGKSDKPDINYNFQDHFKYVNEFIDGLQLADNNKI